MSIVDFLARRNADLAAERGRPRLDQAFQVGSEPDRSPPSRSAFTLIELLVVLSTITLLMGVLVPAVQKVRSAAARIQCANNLHQLGIAAHHYHDVNGAFPPAVQMNAAVSYLSYDDETANFGPNWAILLLPYLEQEVLYQQQAASIGSYMSTGDSNWRSLRTTPLTVLLCPADTGASVPYSGVGGNWARGNYAANAGPAWKLTEPGVGNGPYYWGGVLAISANGQTYSGGYTYAWVGDVPVVDVAVATFPYQSGGVMCVNWGTRLSELSQEDGASNNILFNEIRIGPAATDLRGSWAMGQVGASITGGCPGSDCWGPNDNTNMSDDIHNGQNSPEIGMGACYYCRNDQANARSQHVGGIQSCFADGSVRWIASSIDLTTWFCLQSRNDALPVDD